MDRPEFGAGIWMFQQFVDRYATDAYGPPVGTLQANERAAAVGDIKVLDINYPFAGDDVTVEQVRDALQRTGLRAQAITPHLYMREFQMGSFTNPDATVRHKAVELGKQAIEAAGALDAKYVKFWPGQDGYDYPFQVDYAQIWDYQVSGVRAVAESAPEMQFAIEYKLKEPRVHMLFSTASRTLLAIQDMGVDNVGIVLDLGHSLFAKETPADVLQMVSRRGKLVSVEVNDNWRERDDDMAVGLYLVPAFVGLGAPYWNDAARGLISGPTRGLTAAHLGRASIEAIAYQVRDVFDVMQAEAGTGLNVLLADCGASRNNMLMQFQADLIGWLVLRSTSADASPLGAAYLAGLNVGSWETLDDISQLPRPRNRFEPRMSAQDRAAHYDGWQSAITRAILRTQAAR